MPVPFSRDLLSLLQRRGLAEEEALRVFAIFFQIRRAHHFIVEGLIGDSACMREFRRRLWDNVFTHDIRHYERCLWSRMEDFSTLLLGETGTGKGTAAAAIGRSGFIPFDPKKQCFAESFTRSFVSINLSQFPETLIESELFGHRKGAFTGAVEAHEGIFARCSPHGAIFLDEIGEVSAPVQIKLLRVLQDRVFSPVGSHEQVRFRGRVIAATNKPLDALRGPGGFRDDFYYRLCSDTITVPPLRQRLREDAARARRVARPHHGARRWKSRSRADAARSERAARPRPQPLRVARQCPRARASGCVAFCSRAIIQANRLPRHRIAHRSSQQPSSPGHSMPTRCSAVTAQCSTNAAAISRKSRAGQISIVAP